MSPRLALLAACLACAPAHAAPRPTTEAPAAPAGARPELNDVYRDPKSLRRWRRNLEREGREVHDRKADILADLSLKPGMVVADVGAGTGLYTLDLARAVGPTGRVLAVDIIPHFLRHIGDEAKRAGLTNVVLVQASADALGLEPASVDLIYLCDVYHHLERPTAALAELRAALRPGGTLVLVDLAREPGKSPAWILEHVRADRRKVLAELAEAGFGLVADHTDALHLRENYILHLKAP